LGRQRARASLDPAITRFAERLRDELGAQRVLLFGSHATGRAGPDSDYDLIIVADRFDSVPPLKRGIGLRDIFYEVGGNAPMDLICLTPEEFEQARQRITLISAVLPEAIDLLGAGDGRSQLVHAADPGPSGTRARIAVDREEIAEFCRRHHIRRLALFGSVLRDDFRPDSDVDVLVEFEPGHVPGFGFIRIQDELSEMLGRKVDLVTPKFLNHRIRERVLAEAELQYAEG
jgi:uncharacterized protein